MKTLSTIILAFFIPFASSYAQPSITPFKLLVSLPKDCSFDESLKDEVSKFNSTQIKYFKSFCEGHKLESGEDFKIQYIIAMKLADALSFVMNTMSPDSKYIPVFKQPETVKECKSLMEELKADYLIEFKDLKLTKTDGKYQLLASIEIYSSADESILKLANFQTNEKNPGDMFACSTPIECVFNNTCVKALSLVSITIENRMQH